MKRETAQRVYFEQVKRTVPIEAVLAKYGLELKRQGETLKGRCPIHQGSNPKQFVVSNGLWHCFGDCDRGGSVIEFVAEMEHVDTQHAALMIARWFAIGSGTVINQHSKRRRRTMKGERPTHKAYSVKKREGQDDWFTPIGSAWPHKNGRGMSIELSALPVGDRIVLFEYTDDDAKEEEQQKAARRKK